MKLNLKKLLSALAIATIAVSASASADETGAGKTLLKVRGHGFLPGKKKANGKNNNALTSYNSSIKNGAGAEISATYFLDTNVAAELAVGVSKNNYRIKFGNSTTPYKGKMTSVPVTLTAQYHFAPTNQFSPYVGAGYHYMFISKLKTRGNDVNIKFNNSHGPVLQAGFDISLNDTIALNLDAKKYFSLKGNQKVRNKNINLNEKAKFKMSPVVLGAGLTFRL